MDLYAGSISVLLTDGACATCVREVKFSDRLDFRSSDFYHVLTQYTAINYELHLLTSDERRFGLIQLSGCTTRLHE